MGDWTCMEVVLQDLTISKEPFFYASANIKNFDVYKNEILDIINSSPYNTQHSGGSCINKTDFKINEYRPYAKLFTNLINPYHIALNEHLSIPFRKINIDIDNLWFQQYNQNDTHAWHTHPKANFSNILYIEKPEEVHTEFYCPITKKILYKPSITEGSILTFPGYLLHRSSLNKTDKTKTVIVFNTNTFEL